MENIEFWTLFLSACLALNLAPGPDMLYILKTTVGGRYLSAWLDHIVGSIFVLLAGKLLFESKS